MLRQTVLFNILLNSILLAITDDTPTIHLLIAGAQTKTVRCLVSNETLNSAITLIPRNLSDYKEPMPEHGKESIITDDRDPNWSWKRSNYYKLGIILDSRWESFSVAKVKNEKNKLIDIDASSFQIPFSVLSSVDANVYLYDEMGKYVEIVFGSIINANCSNSCNKSNISMGGLVFNEWNHFILDIDNKSCDLSQCNNTDCQHVMKIVSPHILKNMQVSSGEFSLWKIHAYNVTYIPSNWTTITNTFKYKGCISLHVRVCEHCSLSIDILGEKKNFSVPTITHNQNWKEITFQKPLKKMGNFQLHVEHTINDEDDFSAISSITVAKSCNYRQLKATNESNNFTCYAIKYPSWKLTTSSFVSRQVQDESTRKVHHIGTTDIHCKMVTNTDECEYYGICELDGSNQTCYCAKGYMGQNCEKQCSDGYYGSRCKNECGKCKKSCNKVDGICKPKKCQKNFYGDRCQKRELPVVQNAPTITTNGTTQVSIEINISQHESNKTASGYFIQYKESGDKSWKNFSKSTLQPKDVKFNHTLDKLKGDTHYTIRTILVSSGEYYNGDEIPHANFRTTCKDIMEEDVIIDATNISAYITLNNSDVICHSMHYELLFDDNKHNFSSYYCNLTSLTPYTMYNITIKNNKRKKIIAKHFRTEEGVPSAVSGIICPPNSNDTINLSWTAPIKPNGVISTYTISYVVLKFKDCSDNEISVTHPHIVTTSNETNWIINGLHPYTVYSIKVWANSKLNGTPSEWQQCNTEASDTLTDEELPRLSIKENENDEKITVSLDKDCRKKSGPIDYNITLACFSAWCDKTVLHIRESEPTNILPYSEYTITAIVSRKKTSQRTTSKKITTKPKAPLQIENVSVYSKTNSSLFLRWSPVYPPRGELHHYIVKLNETEVNVTKNPCIIWKESHCAELKGLNISEVYSINICGKNINTTCGNYSETHYAKTVIEKSFPVENLTTKFDDKYNLTLKWNHPNTTNGPLSSFKIRILDISDDSILHNKTDKLSKEWISYTHKILVEFYSKKVKATIVAINAAGESDKLESDVFYTPPKTPTINVTYTSDNTNTTVNLKIWSSNLDGESTLYLVVTNKNGTRNATQLNPKLKHIINTSKINEEQLSWIEKEILLNNNSNEIIEYKIGDNETKFPPALNIEKTYILTLFIENEFQNLTRSSYYKIESKDKVFLADDNNALWWLFLLLLFVSLIIGIILKRKRLNVTTMMRNNRTVISTDHPSSECAPLNNIKAKELRCTELVRIEELEGYIRKALQSGELNRQHEVLPRGQTKPWAYGKIEQNLKKNRYNNLAAYDHTRVVLSKIKGDKYSDYINANYIDGYNVPKAYIATQGPKPATVKDFWRMIWQENVRYIVMVTNLIEGDKKKTEKYWPDINTNSSFDNIKVEAILVKVFADYEQRVFKVLSGGEEREVTQLHFVSWPDHGIPLYAETLVPFLRELQEIHLGESPVLVHCSAGVGRTGTIILCDICIRMALNEQQVDVFHYFAKLREQRANMVDNDKQYKLVHLTLLNYLIAPDTNYSCDNNFNSRISQLIDSKGYISQINHLKINEWQDVLMDQDYTEKPTGCPEKDRFPLIIPNTNSRVYIKPYPEGSENSSYINAVKVDGFHAPGKFIVTQQPLPNTLGDFWRLMDENEINLIISLNDTKNETCCDYWPTVNNSIMSPVPYITLQHTDTISTDIYNIVTVKFSNKNNPQKDIYILQFKRWSHNDLHPVKHGDIIALYEEMMRLAKLSKTILVTCFDGATASGLFVTLAFVLDKIKLEQKCNACLAVKATRRARREFVQKEDQFVYLYRCAMEYLKEFETYANFS